MAAADDSAALAVPMPTLLRALIEPGTGPLLLPYINMSLLALLGVLLITYFSGIVEGVGHHLVIMGVLAICLLLSINWFIAEFEKVQKEGEAGGASTAEPSEKPARAAAPRVSQEKTD